MPKDLGLKYTCLYRYIQPSVQDREILRNFLAEKRSVNEPFLHIFEPFTRNYLKTVYLWKISLNFAVKNSILIY